MKSFLASLIAIAAISVGAKYALDNYDWSSQGIFSSQNTSLGN